MKIIHASDLHFGNSARVFEHALLLRGFEQLCRAADDEGAVFIVSGDIGFKGQASAYGAARKWFDDVTSRGLVKRERILFCPGNHDLCDGGFDALDAFSFGVRKDAECTFGSDAPDVRLVFIDRTAFLLLNSAHHLVHEYGFAPIAAAKAALEAKRAEVGAADRRIAVLHHHLIPAEQFDTSTLRNTYGLLTLLDTWNFDVVLHGHRHAFDDLPVGRSRMSILGVTSLNFAMPGISNGMLLFDPAGGGSMFRYALLQDLTAEGSAGALRMLDAIQMGPTS